MVAHRVVRLGQRPILEKGDPEKCTDRKERPAVRHPS
jgi:hypothetical protein